MRKSLLLIGLASCPLLSQAQAFSRSFYAGAKLSGQSGQPFNSYSSARFGPALTAGGQLSSRLGIELTGAYNWRHDTYHYAYTTSSGPVTEDYDTHLRTLTMPILLRATLTKPTQRWHLDALVGPTLLFYFTNRDYLQTAQGQTTRSGTDRYTETQATLTLGPSVRYAVASRLELVADVLVNYYISGFPYTLAAPFSSQLSSHVLVGAHYRFGQ